MCKNYDEDGFPTIRLHRFILKAKKGYVVDHINHDTLNNTRKNLREVTAGQNSQNRKGPQAGSKSKIRGVPWDNTKKTWICEVILNNKSAYRNTFKNLEEAEKNVIIARKKLMPYSIN